MTSKIIAIDFAGTLVKAEIIEEANEFRTEILNRSKPTTDEHADPDKLYKVNNEFVEKLTGLKQNADVFYTTNEMHDIKLKGNDIQTQIATNLFQIGMYMAAKKHRLNIIPEGFIEQLKRLKQKGYKLAIVSGVRSDIISGMLEIAGVPVEFDFIKGQPPILGRDNLDDIKTLENVEFFIGDKMSDLERAKPVDAKSIFVKWGHPSGGEEEFADFTIKTPKELDHLIK